MRMADEHEVGAWEHVYVYDQRNSKFEVVATTSQKAPLRFGFEVGATRYQSDNSSGSGEKPNTRGCRRA